MNDKGTDQTACMCRIVCAFVIRIQQSQVSQIEANVKKNKLLKMHSIVGLHLQEIH